MNDKYYTDENLRLELIGQPWRWMKITDEWERKYTHNDEQTIMHSNKDWTNQV